MTFGPRLPDGRATVILVSDDNFHAAQRTWFLVFAVQ
jgi:3-phytase